MPYPSSYPSVFIGDSDKEARYNAAEYKSSSYWKEKELTRKKYIVLLLIAAVAFALFWNFFSGYWDSNAIVRGFTYLYVLLYGIAIASVYLILRKDRAISQTTCSGYYSVRIEFKTDFLYYEFKNKKDQSRIFPHCPVFSFWKDMPVHHNKIFYSQISQIHLYKERSFITITAEGKEWIAKNEWEEISAADFETLAHPVHTINIPLVFQNNDMFLQQLQNTANIKAVLCWN